MICLGIAVSLLIIVVNGSVNEIVGDVLNSPHILRSNSIIPRVLPALVDTPQWRLLLALHTRPHILLACTGSPNPLVVLLTRVHLRLVRLRVVTGGTTLHANKKGTHGTLIVNASCMSNEGSRWVSLVLLKAFHVRFPIM
jgi:hypothetical protein